MKWILIIIVLTLIVMCTGAGETQPPIDPLMNLAPKPPMGWNSWNCFGQNINEKLIKEIVDAADRLGLREKGYEYIIIDDGWMSQDRDSNGDLCAHEDRFPSGMKSLGDYIHSKGFRFGLYTSVGRTTCEGFPGSFGHEYADMKKFAEWGVDYVKVDWCTFKKIWFPFWNYKARYYLITSAVQATGRPMVISMCNWGFGAPWLWTPKVAHMYRIFYDIKPTQNSIETIIKEGEKLQKYNGPNSWMDLDMLEVGNGISTQLARRHFEAWCRLRSPLILGCDLRTIDQESLAIVTDENFIRINQNGDTTD